jgi:hypothetical protein
MLNPTSNSKSNHRSKPCSPPSLQCLSSLCHPTTTRPPPLYPTHQRGVGKIERRVRNRERGRGQREMIEIGVGVKQRERDERDRVGRERVMREMREIGSGEKK